MMLIIVEDHLSVVRLALSEMLPLLHPVLYRQAICCLLVPCHEAAFFSEHICLVVDPCCSHRSIHLQTGRNQGLIGALLVESCIGGRRIWYHIEGLNVEKNRSYSVHIVRTVPNTRAALLNMLIDFMGSLAPNKCSMSSRLKYTHSQSNRWVLYLIFFCSQNAEYSFQEALLNKHSLMKMMTADGRLLLQVHLLEELLLPARSACSTLSVHCVTINSYIITLYCLER